MFSSTRAFGRRSYALWQLGIGALLVVAVLLAGEQGRAQAWEYVHPLASLLAVAATTLPSLAVLLGVGALAVCADARRLADLDLSSWWLAAGWGCHCAGMFALVGGPWVHLLTFGSILWLVSMLALPGRAHHRRRAGRPAHTGEQAGRTAAGRPLPPPPAARAGHPAARPGGTEVALPAARTARHRTLRRTERSGTDTIVLPDTSAALRGDARPPGVTRRGAAERAADVIEIPGIERPGTDLQQGQASANQTAVSP